MSQRHEFVMLANNPGSNLRELCRRFGISAKTGYKWLHRFAAEGETGLRDRSRRPHRSPRLSSEAVVDAVLQLRHNEPTWGGRKLRRRLQDLQHAVVPAASTCTEILRRAHLLNGPGERSGPFCRFERAQPNELWQMDFKGDFATQAGVRCFPLTVLDDHSRFNVALLACGNQKTATVQAGLQAAFRRYGLPEAILCDNGAPWGCSDPICPYTTLGVWLLRLGIAVKHGRPYHPQTQGKDERFHRTLERDLLRQHTWSDLAHCGHEFDRFRHRYNCTRPHDSLRGDTPAVHYRPSPRPLPEHLPALEYPANDVVLRVRTEGRLHFRRRYWHVGRAFGGLPVGLRPSTQAEGQWLVFFGHRQLGQLDLTIPEDRTGHCDSIYAHPPA